MRRNKASVLNYNKLINAVSLNKPDANYCTMIVWWLLCCVTEK